MKLPTLYKKTSKGALEQWRIWVDGAVIHTEYGLVGGKLQHIEEIIREGKNLGKKNATTAEEQAAAETKSEWTKKNQRKGYVKEQARALAGENDAAGGIRPMLAQKFHERGGYLCFEKKVCGQRKLDGLRCESEVYPDGTVKLWSREQNQFKLLPHVEDALREVLGPVAAAREDIVRVDGELYNHLFKKDFRKISSAVRAQKTLNPEQAAMMQYHVYDLPEDGVYSERYKQLQDLIPLDHSRVKLVECFPITSDDEVWPFHAACVAEGYEGGILRADEVYLKPSKPEKGTRQVGYEEGVRSNCLQKVKDFDDGEFPILGVEEGRGKMAGKAVFICRADNGETFKCKLDGPMEELRVYLTDESTWKGKKLTIEYFGLTDTRQVPRQPIGKDVRDYE